MPVLSPGDKEMSIRFDVIKKILCHYFILLQVPVYAEYGTYMVPELILALLYFRVGSVLYPPLSSSPPRDCVCSGFCSSVCTYPLR